MRVAYLLTAPRPPRPELDATVRGVTRLAERFPGPVEFLYPGRRYVPFVTRSLVGAGRGDALRALDRAADVHLLVSDRLRPYPFLRRLQKPLVYALATGLDGARRPLIRPGFRARWRLVVASDSDREIAAGWGFDDAVAIPSGIELERFTREPPPGGSEFFVLAGSAPWTRRQFHTKGVEHLLRAARELPELRLVFLWRGAHEAAMVDLVRQHGLSPRVEIVNRRVDVNQVLARVHAAVVLARSAKLVKAFPDSLIEALAAGRPIVASRTLGAAGFIRRHGCGEVVESHSTEEVVAALRRLIAGYAERRAGALGAPLERFSRERYLDAYGGVFAGLLAAPGVGVS